MELDTFYAKATWYVRPEQTLMLASVGRRVGGPGSGLWAAGWRLGRGGRRLADVAPAEVPWTLMLDYVTGESVVPMDSLARSAWMRTWKGPAPLR